MEENGKNLEEKVNKVLLTHHPEYLEEDDHLKENILQSCQRLEEEGFGMLEDPNNPGKIYKKSYSVVFPDGKVVSEKEINSYKLARRGSFNSLNKTFPSSFTIIHER